MQEISAPRSDQRLLHLLRALDFSAELTWSPDGAGGRWAAHLPVLAWLLRTSRPAVLVDASGDAAGFAAAREVIAENGLATDAVALGVEAALDRVRPGSIDLLRLAAPPSQRAAPAVLAEWQPLLSDRAVVLCHGLTSGDAGSGLWPEWRALAAAHPSFGFPHREGVGILAVGHEIAATLRALFEANGTAQDAALVERIFAERGEALRGQAERAALQADLELQSVTSRQLLDRCRAEIARLEQDVRLYRDSTSWRITAPLRGAAALLSRLRRPHPRTVPRQVAGPPVTDAKIALRADLTARLRQFLASGARLRVPAEARPKVSILLVLHNAAELTFGCLTSIAAWLADASVEVVIVDNASSDDTAALLQRVDGAKLIRNGENLHFLRGVNQAARQAAGKTLLLLNNDAQLLPGSLEAALAALGSANDVGAVGARIVLPDGTLQEAGSIVWRDGTCSGYARGRDPAAAEAMFRRDVDFCSGAFLLTPRHVFEELGGFDERFAPAYYEETDYCARLWQHGFRVVYEPAAVVRHYEFGSATGTAEALERQRRNLAVFRARHATWLATKLPNAAANILSARQVPTGRPRLLMIEDRVPHRQLGAGYPRAADLLRALTSRATVTLFPMQRFSETPASVRAAVPAEVEVCVDTDASHLEEFMRQRRGFYDAIVVCRPHNLRRFVEIGGADPALRGTAHLIYDAEAILATREALRREVADTPQSLAETAKMMAEEMALALRADVVLAVSVAEQRVFAEHGVADTIVLGHALTAAPTPEPFAARGDILFVGAVHEAWTPNADGLRWFAEDILPPLRRALGVPIRLRVVGAIGVAAIRELGGVAFDVVGAVEDLRPHYAAARLVVAPTRFASGLPHKVVQAAAHGVPVVATDLLARQLGWVPGRDLLAASDAAAFAAECARLYQDETLWQRLRVSALDRVRADCAPEQFETTVARLVEKIPVRR